MGGFRVDLPGVVYALIDPRFDVIRYIGATQQVPPEKRLDNHLKSQLGPCRGWLDELAEAGVAPLFRVLRAVPPSGRLADIERRMIRDHENAGGILCNDAGYWRINPPTPQRLAYARSIGLAAHLTVLEDVRRHAELALQDARSSRDDNAWDRARREVQHAEAALHDAHRGGSGNPPEWAVTVTWQAHCHSNNAPEEITDWLAGFTPSTIGMPGGDWSVTLLVHGHDATYAAQVSKRLTETAALRGADQCCIVGMKAEAVLAVSEAA